MDEIIYWMFIVSLILRYKCGSVYTINLFVLDIYR